ncbi:MAG TPA: hypothetical protein VHJ83_01665, partial [Micromonosporaceae bacterium]|nr:hypothetical protein [Micromonosporaceae bacterium]
TDAHRWERLWLTSLPPNAPAVQVVMLIFGDPGTAGEVRVTVDGSPLATSATVIGGPARHTVEVRSDNTERELAIEARRTRGEGLVRVAAQLLR